MNSAAWADVAAEEGEDGIVYSKRDRALDYFLIKCFSQIWDDPNNE
jgi:hypothetical protein